MKVEHVEISVLQCRDRAIVVVIVGASIEVVRRVKASAARRAVARSDAESRGGVAGHQRRRRHSCSGDSERSCPAPRNLRRAACSSHDLMPALSFSFILYNN